jgi:exosome complex component RRP4
MIQLLRRESGCDFWVGRNGLIVINGPDPSSEFAAIAVINLIDREAHKPGLTERALQQLRKFRGGPGEQA